MSTSTAIRAKRQNFYLTIWSNKNSNHTQEPSALSLRHKGPVIIERKNPFERILQFFDNHEISNTVIHQVIPAGNLYSGDRLVLKFTLTEKYAGKFSLLRGLFEFGKWPGLRILSDFRDQTFEIIIVSRHADELLSYFEKLFSDLTKEINFKAALKDLLHVQEVAAGTQKSSLIRLNRSLD